jgi:dGTPase
MFAYLYTNPVAKGEESKAEEVVVLLYQYYLEHTDEMPEEYRVMMEAGEDKNISVCDYIAGMSDNYAIDKFQEIYIPRTWSRM